MQSHVIFEDERKRPTTVDASFDEVTTTSDPCPLYCRGKFTHEYVIAVLGDVVDWSRAPLITKLLPLCTDINENSAKIKANLSDWEVVCTKRVFELAMNN